MVSPLALPTLLPLVEQYEKPTPTAQEGPTQPSHALLEDVKKAQQIQQEQHELNKQHRLQQATDKMGAMQHLPPAAPIVPTTLHVISSSCTSSPDLPQPPPRQGFLNHDSPLPSHVTYTFPPPSESTAAPPKKETILLVEDNPIYAKIGSAVLRRHQFKVELAGNGQVALEKIKLTHDNFQLILMGITKKKKKKKERKKKNSFIFAGHLLASNGRLDLRAFITSVRKRTYPYHSFPPRFLLLLLFSLFYTRDNLVQIPIIALTAAPHYRTACLEAGCDEFMSKPLDYPLLIAILKQLSDAGCAFYLSSFPLFPFFPLSPSFTLPSSLFLSGWVQ
jgi:CheY-like chemotaxis protein